MIKFQKSDDKINYSYTQNQKLLKLIIQSILSSEHKSFIFKK